MDKKRIGVFCLNSNGTSIVVSKEREHEASVDLKGLTLLQGQAPRYKPNYKHQRE